MKSVTDFDVQDVLNTLVSDTASIGVSYSHPTRIDRSNPLYWLTTTWTMYKVCRVFDETLDDKILDLTRQVLRDTFPQDVEKWRDLHSGVTLPALTYTSPDLVTIIKTAFSQNMMDVYYMALYKSCLEGPIWEDKIAREFGKTLSLPAADLARIRNVRDNVLLTICAVMKAELELSLNAECADNLKSCNATAVEIPPPTSLDVFTALDNIFSYDKEYELILSGAVVLSRRAGVQRRSCVHLMKCKECVERAQMTLDTMRQNVMDNMAAIFADDIQDVDLLAFKLLLPKPTLRESLSMFWEDIRESFSWLFGYQDGSVEGK